MRVSDSCNAFSRDEIFWEVGWFVVTICTRFGRTKMSRTKDLHQCIGNAVTDENVNDIARAMIDHKIAA
jgi:hypothetical protein